MARAFGSYPECRRFESTYRYHNGPVVKRLRHGPFTAVTRVRFPSGSPDKKRRRQGAFFIGGPQSPRPHGKYRNRQEKQQTAAVLPAFLFLRDPLQRAHRGAARPGLRPGRPAGALPAPSGPTIKPPHPRPAGGPLRGLRRAAPARRLRRRPCGAPHKTAPCTFSAPCINPAPAAHTTAESFPEGVCTGRAVLTPGRDETPCAFSLPGLFLPKKGLHLRSVCGIIL